MRHIKAFNLNYDGHDFCGEIDNVSDIISSQPTELTINIDETFFGYDYISDDDCRDLVIEYCAELGILEPTSFDFTLID